MKFIGESRLTQILTRIKQVIDGNMDTVDGALSGKVDKTTTVNGHALSSNVTVSKSDVGLGNVDNTSDLNKPISTATQTALNEKANISNTYTKSEVDALVSAVFRYKGTKATYAEILAITTKAVGDVWFCGADSSEYAWNGEEWEALGAVIDLSAYLTSLSVAGLTLDSTHTTITSAQLLSALGVYTSSQVDTALSGKVNTTTKVNGHALSSDVTVTKGDVGLGNVDNTSDANKPVSTATQTALNSKADQSTTYTKTEVDNLLASSGSVDTVNGVSPDSNKNVEIYASDIKLSSGGSSTISDGLSSKANQATTYTKTETDSAISTAVSPLNTDITQLKNPFVGATSGANGVKGLVPAPLAGDQSKFLCANGRWVTVSAGGTSLGFLPLTATLSPQDWVQSGNDYVALVQDSSIVPQMVVNGLNFDDAEDIPARVTAQVVSEQQAVSLTTSEPPVEQVTAYISLVVDGSDVLQELNPFIGATALQNGTSGIVPAPLSAQRNAFLCGDGTWAEVIENNAGSHNCVYRGKFLGTAVTEAQYASIQAGTFEDMYIGDYWTINNVNYRIAGFDYWYNTGDGDRCQTHHVVIVPDTSLTTGKLNKNAVVTGAYGGSDFYTGNNSNTARATAQSTVKTAFGSSHILSHREFLQNNVTSGGYENGHQVYDVEIELMSEIMVFGSNIFHNITCGSTAPSNYTMSTTQLPLFRHRPDMINIGDNYWLRDVAAAAGFSNVAQNGFCDYHTATQSYGIRPAFAIKKSETDSAIN